MMRCLFVWLAVASSALAQNADRGTDRRQPARVEGKVVSDLDGRGLRRAHVVLRPIDAGLPAVGTDADEQGEFELRDIAPGRYTLTADRDGFLPSSVFLRGTLRMPVSFLWARDNHSQIFHFDYGLGRSSRAGSGLRTASRR
jgi:protocatechuate 3,4-dioxygenase beta subunit